MSENETLQGSGTEAAEVKGVNATQKAEGQPAEGQASEVVDKQEEKEQAKPRRNGTREYIERLQTRWNDPAALEKRLNDLKARAPKLEDHEFDAERYVGEAIRHDREIAKVETELERVSETIARVTQDFGSRIAEFELQAPDYRQAVSSIPPQFLPDELQFAIMTHERGPEIAYHLAQNDEDLFFLNSVRPDLVPAAVERLAKRIAAPQRQAQQPATQTKPITNAPAPPATVSGRKPTETPDDKLTDAEWYRREKEREAARLRG